MGAPYEAEDLDRAIRLAKTMTWREVGAIMNRPWHSLYVTADKYKKGAWQVGGKTEKARQNNALCEMMVENGVTGLAPIADAMGVSQAAACRRLGLLGLDAEMRGSSWRKPSTDHSRRVTTICKVSA